MFFTHRQRSHRTPSLRSKNAFRLTPRRFHRTLRGEALERRDLLAISSQALLPDLTPWASQEKGFIYDWTIVGNDLRLTTAMANIGTGPMELRGGATHADTSQDVYQRVYEPDGNYTDVLAGTFTYHPEHGHIHFDEFAQFRLRQVLPDGGVGDIVATGDKVSFCLLDVDRYNASGPILPHFLNCGQIQGISVGWADVYSRGLEGQSIEITNVPDGNYWLEVVVDPDNHIIESDETNNVARIQILLQRPTGGGGAIAPDAFESDNTFEKANILAPPEDHVYPDLSIHASTNADYFRVTASATGPMAVSISFLNSQGDLDLEVYDAARTRIGRSQSRGDSELVNFNAVAGQFYYMRVYGYDGATNPNYTLTVDQPEGVSGGAPDQFEDNDTLATARELPAVDQTYTNLNIHTSGDDDYYKVTPTTSGTMKVSLAFTNADGDLDLEILDASQVRLDRSDSTGNGEQVSFAVTAGQTYYIHVYGYHAAVNGEYAISLALPPPAVVTYFSTTGGGTLKSTDGSPPVAIADSDIVQLTVQGDGKYEYRLYLDGSDVGLTTSNEDIDAFAILPDGSIVISTVGGFSVPGVGRTPITGGGQDLLRFVPSSLGDNTAGTWSTYVDGSDVGLSGSNENIDAVGVLTDGRILISTTGTFAVPGVSGEDEDLVAFTPKSLGTNTSGKWAMYFDGSDVGLTSSSEDVDGLFVRENPGANPTLYLSTTGACSVLGASGTDEDVVAFTPISLGPITFGLFTPALAFDGSLYGLSAFNLDGVAFAPSGGSAVRGLSQRAASSAPLVAVGGMPTAVPLKSTAIRAATSASGAAGGVSAKDSALVALVGASAAKKVDPGAGMSSDRAPVTSGSSVNASTWDRLATSLDNILRSALTLG